MAATCRTSANAFASTTMGAACACAFGCADHNFFSGKTIDMNVGDVVFLAASLFLCAGLLLVGIAIIGLGAIVVASGIGAGSVVAVAVSTECDFPQRVLYPVAGDCAA